MKLAKRTLSIVSLFTAITLASCGDPHNYGKAVADNFINSCSEDQQVTREECTCVFDKIQKKYTFKEFAEIDKKAEAGNFDPEFVKFAETARSECSRSTP
jgi:hypothetical protein